MNEVKRKANTANGVMFLSALAILAAMALGFFGLATLTQATQGVGLVASACLAAIFARILQAEVHHRCELNALTKD